MLKLTYTDSNFQIERLNESLTDWLNLMISLYLCAAKRISIEPCAASFLIAGDLPGWTELEALIAENRENIEFDICDSEYMEVSLRGIWISSEINTCEGIFVCDLTPKLERVFDRLRSISSDYNYS